MLKIIILFNLEFIEAFIGAAKTTIFRYFHIEIA